MLARIKGKSMHGPAKMIDTPMTRAIIKACALHCGATYLDVKSTNKVRRNARARLLAFHLLRSKASLRAKDIAPIFHFTLDGIWDAMSKARRKQPTADELSEVWAKAKAILLREIQDANLKLVDVRIVADGDGPFRLEWNIDRRR